MIPEIYDTEVLYKYFTELSGHALYKKFGYNTKAGFCKHLAALFPSKPSTAEWSPYVLSLLHEEEAPQVYAEEAPQGFAEEAPQGFAATSKPFSQITPIKEVRKVREVHTIYAEPWESLGAEELIKIIIKTPGVSKVSTKLLSAALRKGEAEHHKTDAVELIKFNSALFENTDWTN